MPSGRGANQSKSLAADDADERERARGRMRLTTSGVGDRGRLAVVDDGMDESISSRGVSKATLTLHSSMDMEASPSPRCVTSLTVRPTEWDGSPIIPAVEAWIG